MKLNNISSYKDFKEIQSIDSLLEATLPRDYASNTTNFSNSLLGRGVISLLKFLKRGVDFAKLEIYRRKFENELAMGVLRTYGEYLSSQDEDDKNQNENQDENQEYKQKLIELTKQVKELPAHKLKELPAHEDQRKLVYGSYDIVPYKDGVAAKDEKNWLMVIKNGDVIYYDINNNKVIKNVPVNKIGDKESLGRVLDIITTAVSNNKIKLGIKEEDIISMINGLKGEIVKDSGLTNKVTKLFQIIGKIRKSNPEKKPYDKLYDITKQIATDARSKGIGESVMIKENFNYNDWIITEGVNNLIGFKKLFGEQGKDLDWSKFKGEDVKKMNAFFLSKELTKDKNGRKITKGELRRNEATNNVNKEAIVAIQYAVQSAIQHTETPASNKLFPGGGGGIKTDETYLARIWKKMVNNVMAKFKYFLNTTELNPYTLVDKGGIKPDKDYVTTLQKQTQGQIDNAKIDELLDAQDKKTGSYIVDSDKGGYYYIKIDGDDIKALTKILIFKKSDDEDKVGEFTLGNNLTKDDKTKILSLNFKDKDRKKDFIYNIEHDGQIDLRSLFGMTGHKINIERVINVGPNPKDVFIKKLLKAK